MASANDIALIKQMVQRAQKQIEVAKKLLEKLDRGEPISMSDSVMSKKMSAATDEGEVVEGVFDGVGMVGSDGKTYTIPANYASKSKLVEGDMLKLTIHDDGSFVYKQIGPVERKRLRGTLMQDEDTGEYSVLSQGNMYKALSASVTYFKGEIGDEAIILIPSDKHATWAAVENIMKQIDDGSDGEDETRPEAPHSDSENDEEAPFDPLDGASVDLL